LLGKLFAQLQDQLHVPAVSADGEVFGRRERGTNAASASEVSSPVITSIVAERLCGSMPMTTRCDVPYAVLPNSRPVIVEPGGQRYFEHSKPLLSLSPPCGAQDGAGQMRTTKIMGSRCGSDSPDA
jgi:hypothetical protein